jgi:Zn-dependent protease
MGMTLSEIVYFLIAFAIVLSVHEASHALIAYYLGDPTAKVHGRLSLNPIRHIDVLGFLVLIFAHFGWGKPVPVNPSNFKHPVRDSALTALAGPVSNFVLAFIFALLLRYVSSYVPLVVSTELWWIFDLSVVWGIFNLIPVPPLDGGKILGLLVPKRWENGYMRFQNKGIKYFVIFMLVDIFILGNLFGFSIVQFIVMNVYELVRNAILFGM